jgi:hypothetical protein
MNKNIKLAVAGAVLALSATANAGIIIPAGDWTLDVNGNVNAFVNSTHRSTESGDAVDAITGGGIAARPTTQNAGNALGINTGLLPSWLGFTGTTRQNDVDVSFTISMQPRVSDNGAMGDTGQPLWRQSFLTFGDKSWGSIKLGKDIGIFASDAILNDMTLLGVGAGAGQSGNNTTLGGIGYGYIYAGWKGQASYTTPNFNGFQATVGIMNPNGEGLGCSTSDAIAHATTRVVTGGTTTCANQDRFAMEGKASYSFSANDVTGKVWVSGASYDVTTNAATQVNYTVSAYDIGANVNAGGFGLTGYYYGGKGIGNRFLGENGHNGTAKRDGDGGYVQATYILPTKTKLGLAYGVNNLDRAGADAATLVDSKERITLGLYHPLTKHLNLVGEFNQQRDESHAGLKRESQTYSAGAILFF